MIIVHLISSFTGGGAERFVVSLCNELSTRKALQVHIISLFDVNEKMFLRDKVSPNVTVHTLSKKLGFDSKTFTRLKNLVSKLKPQVVNTHLRAFNYNYLNLLFNKNVKYFHTLHSDAILECPSKKNRGLRQQFYKRNVVPITISEESSKSFRDCYRLENDVLIYNGREAITKTEKFEQVFNEVKDYKLNESTTVFLSIANLLPVKGHKNLVSAFTTFVNNGANAILLLIGDRRPGDDAIYKTIKDSESQNIRYLGVKHNVEDYLLCANVFTMSSNIEGMPITLIEAMSSGCVTIVTPVGGMKDMIKHKENGILTNDTSADALCAAMTNFMSLNQKTIEDLKTNAKQSYENRFSIEKSASAYLNLYQK